MAMERPKLQSIDHQLGIGSSDFRPWDMQWVKAIGHTNGVLPATNRLPEILMVTERPISRCIAPLRASGSCGFRAWDTRWARATGPTNGALPATYRSRVTLMVTRERKLRCFDHRQRSGSSDSQHLITRLVKVTGLTNGVAQATCQCVDDSTACCCHSARQLPAVCSSQNSPPGIAKRMRGLSPHFPHSPSRFTTR